MHIDIDDANNGYWLEKHFHRRKSYAYNKEWSKVINKITQSDAIVYAKKFMKSIYGINL